MYFMEERLRKPVLISALAMLLMFFAIIGTLGTSDAQRHFTALSAAERAWLDENRDNIVLTYDANFPPIEFQDKNGNFAGIAADIIAKVEKQLDVRFQKKPSRDWNALLASLGSGEAYLEGGIVRTPQREHLANFTAPYIVLPHAIITKKNAFTKAPLTWDGLKGKRVAVVSGYASETFVRESSQGSFEVVPVQNVQEGLRNVSFGVVDAFVENLATTSYYIETETLTNLRVAGTTDHTSPMSIGVSRKYPLLYSAVQKALSEIPREEIEASRKRWISLGGEGVISPEIWRSIKLAALFSALLLLGLAGISYILKRRLNEKICSLKEAQQELLEQSERLTLATEATNAEVWDFYPDTGKAYFSDHWYTLLGYKPGSIENTFAGWFGLLHPEDRVAADHTLMEYIDTGGNGLFEAEYRIRQADGSYRWVLGKGRAIAWDKNGVPSRLVGLNLDIQKIKDVQKELRESEERYRSIIQNLQDVYFRDDMADHLVMISPSGLRLLGYSMDEVLGQPSRSFYINQDEHRALLAKLQAEGVARDQEVLLKRRDGSPIQVSITASYYHDAEGRPLGVEGIFRDITERKQTEAALRQSEEKFRAIFNNAPVGIFRTSFEGQVLEANAALARMHGCGSAQEYIDWAKDLGKERYAHPEDRQRLLEALLENPSGVRLGTELRRKDGSIGQAIISAVMHLDEHGKPTFLDGAIEDITERQMLEMRLSDQLAFQQALLDTIPYAVFYKGADTRFVGVNKAYEECFGVRREDLIGKQVLDLAYLSAEDREHYQAEDEAVIASVGQVEREMPFLFADGLLHHTLYSVTGFRLTDGTPGGLIGVIVDITDLKRAEEALLEEKRFSETLLDGLPNIFYLYDADLRLRRWNRNHEINTGFSAEELRGRYLGDWFATEENRTKGIEGGRRILSEVRQGMNENALQHKDGHEMPYILTGVRLDTPEGPMMMGVGVDITERKRAEEALCQSEEKFSRIFEMAPESISFVRLKDSMRIDANAAFETITGYPRAEAIGQPVQQIGIWDEPDLRDEFLKRLLDNGYVKDFEFMLRRKDGSLRRVVSSAQLVTIAGEQCYVSVIHDITDERRMQELLIQSEKMMSVGNLAAGIAHEINNPLGIVHQAVQNLILRTKPDQKKNLEAAASLGLSMDLLQQYIRARKLDVFLEDIQAAAMRASGIIRNMLNFSRRTESRRQISDMRTIVQQSVFLASSDYDLKKSFDFKRIEIIQDIGPDIPACSCTETEIEQVLLNLLRNAAQAMAMAQPPIANPRIDIRLRTGKSCVRIEVSDNGPGMTPDTKRKVFEPFFTTKPPGVGTGLGLSVSYFIITKGHGGKMWLTTAPGKGTTFFIELPVGQQEDAHA
ncbi:MAG: hypothetical protein CVU73_05210 [Deltaproteobacteria bacterium HGW-Deltaproteobacteria-8]|jgi:PAS domain S-box-containing protein|nr:MAG: hypothetical protein CVU73_05210 [Deltaproteobacteria bacterium HGW-Deltaproteobacteria-8]